MTVHRFFVEPEAIAGDRFPLPASIERQVRRVLRLTDGDRLVLLADDGFETHCRIAGSDCVVEARRTVTTEPRHRLTIGQALLKGDALEEVVRQGTELGVIAFRLIVTERSVAREVSARRLERLRAIAREAAEQSERGVVPAVDGPIGLADAFEPDAVLLFERNEGRRLRDVAPPPTSILIGPEG